MKKFKKNDEKFVYKQTQELKKAINKIKVKENDYSRIFKDYELCLNTHKGCTSGMTVMSNIQLLKTIREQMVATLISTNYYRINNRKWTPITIICFLTEAFELVLNGNFYELTSTEEISSIVHPVHTVKINKEDERYEDYLEELCSRYGVSFSRMNTQIALFIRNAKSSDVYNIYNYFSPYEILSWEYRNPEKLEDELQEGKLNEYCYKKIKSILNSQ